jgi:hypothetical protein
LHYDTSILQSAIHCILPHLTCKKISARILRKWNGGSFQPNKRFCRKNVNFLVKLNIVDPAFLKLQPNTIDANFAAAESNVDCTMNGTPATCCADSNANHCIMSNQTFKDLKLDPALLNKKQTFNICSATSLELDAIQGQITLQLIFQNVTDGSHQTINQTARKTSRKIYQGHNTSTDRRERPLQAHRIHEVGQFRYKERCHPSPPHHRNHRNEFPFIHCLHLISVICSKMSLSMRTLPNFSIFMLSNPLGLILFYPRGGWQALR